MWIQNTRRTELEAKQIEELMACDHEVTELDAYLPAAKKTRGIVGFEIHTNDMDILGDFEEHLSNAIANLNAYSIMEDGLV